jgi:DNA-directed RNA polymerase specialized sigma24 family protein
MHKAFSDYREELAWLALFLTGDNEVAEACIVDACAVATTHNGVFLEWLGRWARRATIQSALEIRRSRIAQLASAYERHPCPHHQHAALPADAVSLLMEHYALLRCRLDVLSRFALILRGIEGFSPLDCALTLGISKTAVETAYCTALQSLEVFSCQLLTQLDGSVYARS